MLMVLYIFNAVKFIPKYDMNLTHEVEISNLLTNFTYFIILSIYLHVMVITSGGLRSNAALEQNIYAALPLQ